jgi:hypothetical protein
VKQPEPPSLIPAAIEELERQFSDAYGSSPLYSIAETERLRDRFDNRLRQALPTLLASARAAVGLAEENARLTVSAAKAASLIDDVLRAFGDEYPARMELLEEAAAYLLAAPGSGREGET